MMNGQILCNATRQNCRARRRVLRRTRRESNDERRLQQKTLRELLRFGFILRDRTGGWGKTGPVATRRECYLRTARDMKRSRMQIIYSGHVQGVGFRYTARAVATGFEVTGMVRNLPDGRVELVAEGSMDELEAFRAAVRDSGLEHFIRDEQVRWAEAAGEFRGFEIAI